MLYAILLLSLAGALLVPALASGDPSVSVVPRPTKLETAEGSFLLTPETAIVVDAAMEETGRYLAEFLAPATGFRLPLKQEPNPRPGSHRIVLASSGADPGLGEEGYWLKVEPDRVVVRAPAAAGAFYACQTLRQLLPPDIESPTRVEGVEWRVPCVTIEDRPRYPWRGGLLDSGRHFFDRAFIKRFIDLLALHKLNRFHWHLTDDQGWRIQIRRYPKLTEVGAWRMRDGQRYGGFYTQQDLRDIVDYARSRHVMIIPEIEMPGHTRGALASYPELSCTGKPLEVATDWGVYEDVYCAGSEKVYEFIEGMLTEVLDLFPSPYIHIGGDECPKARWKQCPRCQERIRAEGLKDEAELQSYFVRRVEAFLLSKGRTLIGWDEILEGGLAPRAVVQSWRGMEGGIAAARAGHDVIMSPFSHCYLDYSYETTPLELAYSFEPTPSELTEDRKKHILGLEANLWTEWMPTPADVDRQAFPRLCALAEVAWSPTEARNWKDFSVRLLALIHRLERLKVGYYRPAVPKQTSLPDQPSPPRHQDTRET